MTVNRGLFVALNGNIGTTPAEARLALAGLLAENSPGVPRSGLLFQQSESVVSGSGSMEYAVSACQPVISRAANDGVYLLALTGTSLVPTTLAPATGSRWDLVFVKQNDTTKGDPDNLPVVGVVQGVASSTPAKPYASVPAGALVLAEAQVFAGAPATNDALVNITQVWRHTVTRGAAIPVRSASERGELTAFNGLRVLRLDYRGIEQTYRVSGWHGTMTCSGTFAVPYVPNGSATGQIDVNFPITFPGIPAVVVTPGSSRLTSASVAVTASDFKATLDNKSGGGAGAGPASWVATYTLT